VPNLPKIEGQPYVHQDFPAYCTGPNGAEGVFDTEAEVPAGWTLPGGKVKPGKSAPVVAAVPVVAAALVSGDTVEVDASGAPWNADLHRPTKSKNKAGLWHMKVGTSRPAAEPLDL